MSDLLIQKHMTLSKLKEFNNLVISKATQLRNPRTRKIYEYFHTSVLPKINEINETIYKKVTRELSKLYRDKTIDVDETLNNISRLISSPNITAPESPVVQRMVNNTPTLSVDTSEEKPLKSIIKKKSPVVKSTKNVRPPTKKSNSSSSNERTELLKVLIQAIQKVDASESQTDSDTEDLE